MKNIFKRNSFVVIALVLVLIVTMISGCIGKADNDAETTTGEDVKYCYLSIDYKTILNNKDSFNKDKLSIIDDSGIIFSQTKVSYTEGETVLEIVKREMQGKKIHIEFETSPAYNITYIKGIANIYEKDCGPMSGWGYGVNGVSPNAAMSDLKVKEGDKIEIRFTCDGGTDLGFTFEES